MEDKASKSRLFPHLRRTSLQKQLMYKLNSIHHTQNQKNVKVFAKKIQAKQNSLVYKDISTLNQTRVSFNVRKDLNMTKSESSHLRQSTNLQKLHKIDKQQKKINKILNIDYPHKNYQSKSRNRHSLQLLQAPFLDEHHQVGDNVRQNQINNVIAFQTNNSHNIANLYPLKNICYDSQFSYKREGDCMTVIDGRLYLMGGCIRRKFFFPKEEQKSKELMLHYYSQNQWHQQKFSQNKPPKFKNLTGHTVQKVSKNMLAFTFGMSGDSVRTLNQYNSSIITFNLDKKQFNDIKFNLKIRAHASTYYDNYLLVHGGIDHEHKYLKQLHVICFNGDNLPKIITIPTGQEIANHKMVTTLGMDISSRISLKENDGIFVFGGENGERKMNNCLKILRLSPTNLENEKRTSKKFEKVVTKGQKPCARINHSMNLIPIKHKIVIIGGNDISGNILSDIWVFDLIFSQWMRFRSNPGLKQLFGGITKHSTVVEGSQLYIFGGYHLQDPGNNNFWMFQFENSKKNKETKNSKKHKNSQKASSFWSISTAKNIDQPSTKFFDFDY